MSEASLNRFRKVAFWEGISFLLLLGIAMPLKYGMGIPEPVKVVGWAHGVLFVGYVLFLVHAAIDHSWPLSKSILAFIASLVPFGPFVFDRRLEREMVEATLADTTLKQ